MGVYTSCVESRKQVTWSERPERKVSSCGRYSTVSGSSS